MTVRAVGVCALSLVLLVPSFYADTWKVVDRQTFELHLLDMESFVIGRMVKSYGDGIFSYGGLPGLVSLSSTPVRYADKPFADQYRAYVQRLPFGAYTPYRSQIGAQGIGFSILDRLLDLAPSQKLQLFRGLTSALSAIVLTAIVLWFFLEIGPAASLFVLASIVLAQWLVIFGRNLWWSLWAFYVPMAVLMHYLRSRGPEGIRRLTLGAMAFAAVLVKCLFNGYEYSTTTLAMMAVPLVYYGVLRRASVRGIAVSLLAAAAGAGLAIAVSLALLCVQIAQVDGSLRAGVDHIIYSLEKRSHADSEEFPTRLAPSLEASTASVLATYLNGTFFDTGSLGTRLEQQRARESFRIRYWHLIVVFLAATGALCLPRRRRTGDPNAGSRAALAAATWFSVLAPLSWFVVFKAHSSIHTRINFIVWQMPFVLFGFAVCGAALTGLLKSFARQSHGTPRR